MFIYFDDLKYVNKSCTFNQSIQNNKQILETYMSKKYDALCILYIQFVL